MINTLNNSTDTNNNKKPDNSEKVRLGISWKILDIIEKWDESARLLEIYNTTKLILLYETAYNKYENKKSILGNDWENSEELQELADELDESYTNLFNIIWNLKYDFPEIALIRSSNSWMIWVEKSKKMFEIAHSNLKNFWWKLDFASDEILYIEKRITQYIKKGLWKIENWESLSVFKKYHIQNDELWSKTINHERIKSKSEKYFPIHFPIIIDHIKSEIQGLGTWVDITEIKKENIIKNTIKKYSYIIYILWEKIKLWELLKFLKLDLTAISSFHTTVSSKIIALDEFEEKDIKEILKEPDNSYKKDLDERLINDKIFATAYRNIFKKIISEWREVTLINSLLSVSEEIEKLFQLEFKNLFIIFSKWVESDWKMWKGITNIEFVTHKLLRGVNIFKKADIAFTKSFNWIPSKPNFFHDINEVFLSKIKDSDLKELFKKFISCNLNEWWIWKFDDLLDQIVEYKQNTAKSKMPETLFNQENIDLDNVDFDIWDKVPEHQKYEIMFSKVIWKNWWVFISDYINLKEIDDNLLNIFTKSYWIDHDVVKKQFEEIKQSENTSIRQFIRNDINNLNLLIIWWRFLLKVKKLEKEWIKVNIKNINEIKEKPYGIIEIISKELWTEILEDEKLTFKPEWKLNNISVETIEEQLIWIFRWLKKWPFDLLNTTINQWWTKVLIKDLTDLYITDNFDFLNLLIKTLKEEEKERENIEKNWEKTWKVLEETYESKKYIKEQYSLLKDEYKNFIKEILELLAHKDELEKLTNSPSIDKQKRKINEKVNLIKEFLNISLWLENWIDTCFNILKKNHISNLEQQKYLQKLIQMQIIPDNLDDINIKNFEDIQDLVEVLKFIKSKRKKMLKMIKIWNSDKDTLENELEKLFKSKEIIEDHSITQSAEKEENNKNLFWPQKSFTRAFQKLIQLYWSDFNKFWDLTRKKDISWGIEDLIKEVITFIKEARNNPNITHISISDSIWEPISDSTKKSGYRDIKLFFTLRNGNVVEQQFHYKWMHKVKEDWIKLSPYRHRKIFEKIKKENKQFTENDLKELFRFAKRKNIQLPNKTIIEELLWEGNNKIEKRKIINEIQKLIWISEDYFCLDKVSCDYTYVISRQLNKNSRIKQKITKIERVLADNAWSEAVIKYLEDILEPKWIFLA